MWKASPKSRRLARQALAIGAMFAVFALLRYEVGCNGLSKPGETAYPPYWAKIPASGVNNAWYEKNNSDTVIVFVHGIFSDSKDCWSYLDSKNPLNSQYWPELVKNDARFGHPAIFLGGYFTRIDSGPYDTRQAAGELRDALKKEGVLEKQNIIFIAHSLGGIVTRFLLLRNKDLFRGKRIGLALYASPSVGAPLANMLSFLSDYFGNKLAAELQEDNPFLMDLDKDFRDLLYNPNSDPDNLKIVGAEGVENFFIIHRKWFLPDKRVLVPESSASKYFGAPVYLRNTDHFSAVKPDNANHPAHELLLTFYAKYKKDFGLNASLIASELLPVFKIVYDEAAPEESDVQVFSKNDKFTRPAIRAGNDGNELRVNLAAPGQITRISFKAEGPAAGWTHETSVTLEGNTAHWIGWSNSADPASLIFTVYYKRMRQVCVSNCGSTVNLPLEPVGEVANRWRREPGLQLRLMPSGNDEVLNNLRIGPDVGRKEDVVNVWCSHDRAGACVKCEPEKATLDTVEVLVSLRDAAPVERRRLNGRWPVPQPDVKLEPWQLVNSKGERFYYECKPQ